MPFDRAETPTQLILSLRLLATRAWMTVSIARSDSTFTTNKDIPTNFIFLGPRHCDSKMALKARFMDERATITEARATFFDETVRGFAQIVLNSNDLTI